MLRLRHLVKDSAIYGFASAARSLVGVFLVPIYTRFFETSDYGVIDTLTTTMVFLTLIVSLGMDTSVALFFYNIRDEVERRAMLTTALLTRLILSVLVSSLLSFIAPVISKTLFNTTNLTTSVILIIWNATLNALVIYLLELLRLRRRAISYSILAISNLILGVLFSILFVVWWGWGVWGVLAGPFVANVVILPIILRITYELLELRFSMYWLRELLKIGLPMIPTAFAGWLIAYANRYFLLYYATSSDVGLLAVGAKASAPVALLTNTFLIAWGPFALSLQQQTNAGEMVAKVLTYFLIAGGTLAVAVGIFTKELLILFTTPSYYPGHVVGGLVVFQLLADTSYYIVSIGLLYTKQTKLIAYSVPLVAIANLLLNWLLTKPYGFVGAALTGFISYALSAFIVYLMAQRTFFIPYEQTKLLRLIALVLISWLIGISLVSASFWQTVILKLLVLFAFVSGLFFLKIVTNNDVKLLRKMLRRLIPN